MTSVGAGYAGKLLMRFNAILVSAIRKLLNIVCWILSIFYPLFYEHFPKISRQTTNRLYFTFGEFTFMGLLMHD